MLETSLKHPEGQFFRGNVQDGPDYRNLERWATYTAWHDLFGRLPRKTRNPMRFNSGAELSGTDFRSLVSADLLSFE